MSSSYRILCVSHTPALEVATGDNGWDWNRPEQALDAIANRTSRARAHHPGCDLIVSENCGTVFWCPPNIHCTHHTPESIDGQWVSHLIAAWREDSLSKRPNQLERCWRSRRLASLASYYDMEHE